MSSVFDKVSELLHDMQREIGDVEVKVVITGSGGLALADKIGAKFVGVIGSDELAQGKIKIKEMETGAESFVDFNDISEFVKENRA